MPGIKNLPVSQIFALQSALAGSGPVRKVEVADNAGLKAVLFSLDEGTGFPEHTPKGDAMLYILKGRARISIGGQTLEPVAGECVAMPAGKPRSLLAAEALEMVMLRAEGSAAGSEEEGCGCHACGCGH